MEIMGLRAAIAIIACRASRFVLRKLGKGGTNAPGCVALALYPDILGELAKGVTSIVVTGTNGKTTTSRMIEKSMEDSGMDYFSNKSGANMLSGIVAEFAMNCTLTGKNKHKYALVECDEAHFKNVSKYIDAKCIVVTNVFRDQLDRYGEVTHTLNSILTGIKNSPNAVVCINADCSLSVSMKDQIPNKVVFYGVESEIYKNRVQEVSDAPYCIKCKTEYVYDYVTYGHLGGFRCPKCGYHRPDAQVAVEKVLESTADSSKILVRFGGKEYEATVNLPGGYNIYNATAMIAAGYVMGMDDKVIINALNSFECGFGRMEKFTVNNTDVRMILIKNPAGCNQVLNFLSNLTEPALFIVALNDRFADGTDISWIWDVDFEKLNNISDMLTGVWVTGRRADEMAMRMKYTGLPIEKIRVIKDYNELIAQAVAQDAPVYLMPTYTAMLDIREIFSKSYGFKEFWE
jgi:UDP-N-acetylmuramyl tripeptide synthase